MPESYNLVEKKIDLTEITVSSKFEEKEEKVEVYKYQVPEGFKPTKQVLVEKKVEPVVETKEEVVEDTPKTPEEVLVEAVVDKLTSTVKKSPENELNEIATSVVLENKINILERQLGDMRRLVSEIQSGTIVHGLGVGGSGGGEVNLKYLDDVDITTIQDGETIIWDSFLGKFIPQAAQVVTWTLLV